MKKNQIIMVTMVISACLALPALAQMVPQENNGKEGGSGEHESAGSAMKDYNNGDRPISFTEIEKANKIIGKEIVDAQNHKLGKVKDLAIDLQAGRIVAVVVGTGGFVGMDEKMVAVPPAALTFTDSGKRLQLADAETFKMAPFFKL